MRGNNDEDAAINHPATYAHSASFLCAGIEINAFRVSLKLLKSKNVVTMSDKVLCNVYRSLWLTHPVQYRRVAKTVKRKRLLCGMGQR